MAAPRPAILSTNFFLAIRSCRPQTYRSIRSPPVVGARQAKLHTTRKRRQQDQGYQRYGPAAAPSMPPPSKPSEPFLPSTEQTKKDASDLELKKAERRKQEAEEKRAESAQKQDEEQSEEQVEEEEDTDDVEERSKPEPDEVRQTSPALQAAEDKDATATDEDIATSPSEQLDPIDDGEPLANKELDMVLSMPTPQEVKAENASSSTNHQHPHLEASPYEHHFDTYTLVQDLCKTDQPEADVAFTPDQSITLMKAIRLMLAQNLDLAKDGLVSKSDTENETYLFRAACSELKTTMETSRFMEAQKQRSQRAQLQHEFDILNQKVSQDIMTMREELKGMFNDRKLGLQEEKRQVDGKIQSLSYRISVDLNSEAKSEVEGLRWILTRRAAMAIGAAALMTLTFLQYYSAKSREQAEIDKKRKAAQRDQEASMKREQERFGTSGTSSRSSGTQTDGIVLGGTAGTNYEESLG